MLFEVAPTHEGLTVAAMLALAAFAIDRLASGFTFLAFRPSEEQQSDEEKERREWRRRLWYFVILSAVALPLVYFMTEMRLLAAMGMVTEKTDQWKKFVDAAMTFLVLVGGADRISAFVGMGGGGGEADEEQPVKLSGTVRVIPAEKGETGAGAAVGG